MFMDDGSQQVAFQDHMVRDQVKNALAINNQNSGAGAGATTNPMMGQPVPYEHSKNASVAQQQVDISAGTSATKSQLITPQQNAQNEIMYS